MACIFSGENMSKHVFDKAFSRSLENILTLMLTIKPCSYSSVFEIAEYVGKFFSNVYFCIRFDTQGKCFCVRVELFLQILVLYIELCYFQFERVFYIVYTVCG